ncbi:flavin reductase family protein [Burkholderia gladioli]|uniref:flavin reductase family protein n=1 Tax=Burkholderia gladioli TaxID=28095 RepID=UPI00163E25F6|nr:flavin reductase family protein [Burkholderia gladioli]
MASPWMDDTALAARARRAAVAGGEANAAVEAAVAARDVDCDAAVGRELAQQFRHAMRRLTASVAIVATREHGSRYGMTATALSALCTEPPSIVVCINRNASLYLPLSRTRRFAVSLLNAGQHELVAPFSGKLEHAARFGFGDWREARGLPVLAGAQATLLCRVDALHAYGSHDLVIGRVEAVTAAQAVAPLLWQDGAPAAARAIGA